MDKRKKEDNPKLATELEERSRICREGVAKQKEENAAAMSIVEDIKVEEPVKTEEIMKMKANEANEAKVDTPSIDAYSQREAFERMTSDGALNLEKIPGLTRRWINPEARRKTGRDTLFQLEENAEAKKVGDLYPAYAPTDLVKIQQNINYMRGTGRLKEEQVKRRELAEKIFAESNGEIKMEENFSGGVFGNEQPKYKKPGTTSYFYGK